MSVKVADEAGRVLGFGRFIGLLTHKAITTRGSQIPILREQRDQMLAAIGAEPGSHDYKAAIEAYDSLPLEFLFPFDVRDVTAVVRHILNATERGGVEIAVVPDPLKRSFFVSAILPRASYDEHLRKDLHALLDAGLLTISRDYVVSVPPGLGSDYKNFDGVKLRLPKRQQDWPHIR